jgi:hypothetical protein
MLLGGAFRRAARCVARRRARRERFLFQGEQCLNQSRVCALAARPLRVVGWTKNRSTAQVNQRVTVSFGEALAFLQAGRAC